MLWDMIKIKVKEKEPFVNHTFLNTIWHRGSAVCAVQGVNLSPLSTKSRVLLDAHSPAQCDGGELGIECDLYLILGTSHSQRFRNSHTSTFSVFSQVVC